MRILVCGYFGFWNLGDEALIEALVHGLRREIPDAVLDVLSNDPPGTREWLGVEATPRRPVSALWRSVASSDVVVIGPGGIFQDVTSVRSVAYYALCAERAHRAGKKVIFLGQGIGPLDSRLGRWLFRRAARRADRICLRDPESLALLHTLCPGKAADLGADLGLLLEADPDVDGSQVLAEIGVARGAACVGICPRPWRSAVDLVEFFGRIGHLIAQTGRTVVLLPFGGRDEEAMSRAIADRHTGELVVLPFGRKPREMLSVITRLDGLLGMRLHSLIAAAVCGIPFAGISYDPKVDIFLRELGMEPVSSVFAAVSADEAAEHFLRMLAPGGFPGERVAHAIEGLKTRAETNLRVLREVVEGTRDEG